MKHVVNFFFPQKNNTEYKKNVESWSFCTEDVCKSEIQDIKNISQLDPLYDSSNKKNFYKKYPDLKNKLNDPRLIEQIESDLNRNKNLYIENHESNKLLKCNNIEELLQELTKEYGLSNAQANFIISTSYQGSIASALHVWKPIKQQIMEECIFQSMITKIKIDNDGILTFSGGGGFSIIEENQFELIYNKKNSMRNNIFFDQDVEKYPSVQINICVNLGKIGNDFVENFPKINIDIAAKGLELVKICDNIFGSIDSKEEKKAVEEIINTKIDLLKSFSDFVENLPNENMLGYSKLVLTEIDLDDYEIICSIHDKSKILGNILLLDS